MPVSSAASDVGLRRASQEDAHGASDLHGVYVVADGMGGESAGEVAASIAVTEALASAVAAPRSADAESVARAAALAAHVAVEAAAVGRRRGMGCTVVVAVLRGRRVSVAHVGDSRAYVYSRAGGLRRLTSDHAHPVMKNVLLRAVGGRGGDSPDVRSEDVPAGGVLLLCTDGLHGPVADGVISRAMGATIGRGAGACARGLVREALAAGGPDNVTAMVVEP